MDANAKKQKDLKRRHMRVRRKIIGTPERPRLAVYRSLRNLYAQMIDDTTGKTLLEVSTRIKDFPKEKYCGNVDAAVEMGRIFAEKVKEKSIGVVVFDRGGRKYHGRIKAFADAVRKGGIKF